MAELESSLHLYQPPLYRSITGKWHNQFIEAAGQSPKKLSWDVSAIMSILGFGYTTGDRTLLGEIKRRPWLSKVNEDGSVFLEKVPLHGRLWDNHDNIAARLEELLCQEALKVCKGFNKIYILLSGGLDSRIVAAVIYKLFRSGQITSDVTCVTWGIEDSRDVAYSRFISKLIGFKWQHIPMGWQDLLRNCGDFSIATGCMVSPVHMHRMDWFSNITKDALVLAGSYGDSVGRAEFSGRHALELDYLKPVNILGLVREDVIPKAAGEINGDLEELRRRCSGEPRYAVCECELEGHYMRNMLAHILSAIGNYGSIYQMFTDPDVYGYMWSLHPSIRDDRIYVKLLGRLSPELASMPWARTGRALSGKTSQVFKSLRKNYHDYKNWTAGPLYERLKEYYVDPAWFGDTGIFDKGKIEQLSALVGSRSDVYGFIPYERWMWLAAFRRMAEFLRDRGKTVEFNKESIDRPHNNVFEVGNAQKGLFRRIIGRSPVLHGILKNLKAIFGKITKKTKRAFLRYEAKRQYPPQKAD